MQTNFSQQKKQQTQLTIRKITNSKKRKNMQTKYQSYRWRTFEKLLTAMCRHRCSCAISFFIYKILLSNQNFDNCNENLTKNMQVSSGHNEKTTFSASQNFLTAGWCSCGPGSQFVFKNMFLSKNANYCTLTNGTLAFH